MFKSSHLFITLLAVLLAVTLFPFSALAVTEDTIEPAPELSLTEDETGDEDAEYAEDDSRDEALYRPTLRALPERGTVIESEELNLPRLTDAELATVKELLAARTEGQQEEQTGSRYAESEKVFEAGVYRLDPEDFDGNIFYVILPYSQMNRNQLQSLISAFDALGIPFDPESLNSTNCVRGMSLLSNAATRGLTADEQNRLEEIRKQIRRGIFDADAFTAVASCRSVQVQMPGYSASANDYLEPFCFYPYRAMTDAELATFALAQETTWEIRPDELEKKARQYAHKVIALPLSMAARDGSRYAYSRDYIEFRNSFGIESESSGLYDSPDETPYEVMVEQNLVRRSGSFPDEPYLARILVDYPAMYSARPGGSTKCGEEELKAAAQRWAEKYLLVPEEEILSEWVFDSRDETWGTVQYRLLTTEWLVCLEMYENNAMYCQCCIYNREHAVEYEDWVLKGSDGEGMMQELSDDIVDSSARRSVRDVLNLPEEMTLTGISKDEEGYVQYRADYIFGNSESAGTREPVSMIVYQTPHFTDQAGVRAECFFLRYPDVPGRHDRLVDGEYLDAARNWAGKALKIPAEDIQGDWVIDPSSDSAGGTVTCRLETAGWTVYLQLDNRSDALWAGFYRQSNPD